MVSSAEHLPPPRAGPLKQLPFLHVRRRQRQCVCDTMTLAPWPASPGMGERRFRSRVAWYLHACGRRQHAVTRKAAGLGTRLAHVQALHTAGHGQLGGSKNEWTTGGSWQNGRLRTGTPCCIDCACQLHVSAAGV